MQPSRAPDVLTLFLELAAVPSPPGGEREMEAGRHLTSDPEEAVERMVACIRALSDDPADALRAERQLRDALELPPEAETHTARR